MITKANGPKSAGLILTSSGPLWLFKKAANSKTHQNLQRRRSCRSSKNKWNVIQKKHTHTKKITQQLSIKCILRQACCFSYLFFPSFLSFSASQSPSTPYLPHISHLSPTSAPLDIGRIPYHQQSLWLFQDARHALQSHDLMNRVYGSTDVHINAIKLINTIKHSKTPFHYHFINFIKISLISFAYVNWSSFLQLYHALTLPNSPSASFIKTTVALRAFFWALLWSMQQQSRKTRSLERQGFPKRTKHDTQLICNWYAVDMHTALEIVSKNWL